MARVSNARLGEDGHRMALGLFIGLLVLGLALTITAIGLRLRRAQPMGFQGYNILLSIGILLIVGGFIGLQRGLAP